MNAEIEMKKIMEVKKMIKLGWGLVLLGTSSHVMAFVCSTNGGPYVPHGNQDIYVTMTPEIQQNYNLIVDLSRFIRCYNEDSTGSNYDWVVFTVGSTVYSLDGATKSIMVNGNVYPSPLTKNTQPFGFAPPLIVTPLPLSFIISPVNNAGQGIIRAGEKVAELNMYKTYPNPNGSPHSFFKWNVFSSSDVYIPTGGCDVSARDVTITLPAYDVSGQTVAVPLTVNCPSGDKQLSYSLSGATVQSSNTIFNNVAPATASPASGIGIKMLDVNNNAIATNHNVSLGRVGKTPVSLGLKAAYAQTGGTVSAGAVQSVIEVTFSYP